MTMKIITKIIINEGKKPVGTPKPYSLVLKAL
jgi:hypothetical protein